MIDSHMVSIFFYQTCYFNQSLVLLHLIFANSLIAVLLSFVMLGAKCDDSLINLCPLFVLL